MILWVMLAEVWRSSMWMQPIQSDWRCQSELIQAEELCKRTSEDYGMGNSEDNGEDFGDKNSETSARTTVKTMVRTVVKTMAGQVRIMRTKSKTMTSRKVMSVARTSENYRGQ